MNSRTTRLAKLTRPALTAAFARTRLFDLLDQAKGSPIIWLAGPPGSGKTTLVADYTARRELNGLWYQIDRGDTDIASSFFYLTEAARARGGGASLPPFQPGYLGNVEAFARTFFRQLFRTEAPYLVFDNYQDAMDEAVRNNFVRVAMNEVPEGGRIFVLSRTDPPAGFSGQRARGRMMVIGWSDLRLTKEECRGIAKGRGVALADAELDDLHSRTQGWAAGLVLLLQGLRSRAPHAVGQSSGTPTVIFDYLAEEIFEKFQPAVREFLLRAAYLPQVTTAMASQLGPGTEVQEALREITASEFLVMLIQTEPQLIFQFHPLLREFLLARAEQSGTSSEIEARRHLVAQVLDEHGHPEQAARLYIRNRDWDSLTGVIREIADTLLEHGRGQTLQVWIEALPESLLNSDPWLIYWLGAARYPYAPREARQLFTDAYQRFSSAAPVEVPGALSALNSLIEAIINDPNDFKLLDPWIQAAATWAPRLSECPPGLEARITGNVFMAMALRQPQHPDLPVWRERARQLTQSTSDPNVQVSLCSLLVALAAWIGQFGRVEPLLEMMRSVVKSPEISPVTSTKAAQAESMYYMLAGDHERCVEASLRGLDIVSRTGVRIWNDTFLINALCGALAEADVASAAGFLEQIESRPIGDRKLDVFLRAYGAAWFAMLQGDAFLAHQHLKVAVRTSAELGLPFFQVIASIGLSQVLFDNGDERGAQQELERTVQIAGGLRNRLLDFTVLMCRAHMALRGGSDTEALGLLRAGLEVGRERGLAHFLWWQPKKVAELCQKALEADIEPDYVRRLVLRRGLMPDRPPYEVQSWPWRFRIEALGAFKLTRAAAANAPNAKRAGRPLDLLKVLVAYGGESVKLERAAEALWPHVDNDYAIRSLTTTLHRLRKDLGDDSAVLVQSGELSLNRKFFWLDTWAFEHASERALALASACQSPEQLPALIAAVRAALGYCRGTLLADDAQAAWSVAPRERFRSQLMRLLAAVAAVFEKHNHIEEALNLYRQALESDPLNEGLYRRLMLALKNAGRPHEAGEIYQRCHAVLKAERQTEPSAATRDLYQSLHTGVPLAKV
jgi:LuxR family transcriptional regulator, maltose regulon positive regulatory protein